MANVYYLLQLSFVVKDAQNACAMDRVEEPEQGECAKYIPNENVFGIESIIDQNS